MQKDDFVAAIEKVREGIGQYLEIMSMLPAVDVGTHKIIQKRFNHFYRIRQRPRDWYSEY